MPRSPEQNQVIREKRIQQILEAALTVFSEKGYHGTEDRSDRGNGQVWGGA